VKFAQPIWLLGMLLALCVGGLLVVGALRGVKALRRFGEQGPVDSLLTHRVGSRRALKGALSVLALAACFIALAQPQYGWGTRRIPATNLDAIVVLDYSKSMYVRDVAPNRIERAKSEVARLIQELPGARFGAVAFAGEPLSFPLTSDGGAIAQFFRQLTPHDMPVGGTAIARALSAGQSLLERDPRSSKHRRVMLLVTDGEDLEGDPEQTARSAHEAGISVFVVQIGGRTPEPIPNIDEDGVDQGGGRRDKNGNRLMSSLSAAGEEQLTQIATITGGSLVRSGGGATGIDEVARLLRSMMTEELSERVETVYADVYAYPLGVALLLLLLEAFIPEVRRRSGGRRRVKAAAAVNASAVLFTLLSVVLLVGCDTEALDPLFTRHSPAVDEAIAAMDAHDAGAAKLHLTGYLGTGVCNEGNIGASAALAERPQASLDLGLALFRIGERYGGRFGQDPGLGNDDPALLARRSKEVACAPSVVEQLTARRKLPLELRAEAHYLLGNLEFLRREYTAAVVGYDRALELMPGRQDEETPALGRDAAHNRALALRLAKENEPPDPPDAGPPSGDSGSPSEDPPQPDAGGGENPDDKKSDDDKKSGDDKKSDDDKSEDQNKGDQEQEPSADNSSKQDDPQSAPDTKAEPPPSQQGRTLSQDDKILDQLERAPTVQQQAARAHRGRMRRGVEDK
jgi:Ca-activated chloride channel family protein